MGSYEAQRLLRNLAVTRAETPEMLGSPVDADERFERLRASEPAEPRAGGDPGVLAEPMTDVRIRRRRVPVDPDGEPMGMRRERRRAGRLARGTGNDEGRRPSGWARLDLTRAQLVGLCLDSQNARDLGRRVRRAVLGAALLRIARVALEAQRDHRRARVDDACSGGRRLRDHPVRREAVNASFDLPAEPVVLEHALRKHEDLLAHIRDDENVPLGRCRVVALRLYPNLGREADGRAREQAAGEYDDNAWKGGGDPCTHGSSIGREMHRIDPLTSEVGDFVSEGDDGIAG